jgi:uncharacterized membrane protein (UPF0136 family)
MNLATLAAIGYGILAGVGGILGYAKARSQTSLISGLISGILLIVGGVAHQQNLSWGLPLAIAVTILLIVVFVIRLAKTRKFMPAGLMVVAGVLTLLGLTA